MGPLLTNLGMRMLIGLGGNVKLMKQLILEGSNSRTLEMNPPLWRDLRVPVNVVRVPSLNAPTWVGYKGGQVLAFADQAILGNEEYVYFACQLPHEYVESGDIYPHVHWVGQDATAGNVYWRLTHSWANEGDRFPAQSTMYVDASNGSLADEHNYGHFGMIDGDDKKISSMLICSLSRHSSNVLDTFTGKDAYFLEFDFHVPVDTLGSRQERIK